MREEVKSYKKSLTGTRPNRHKSRTLVSIPPRYYRTYEITQHRPLPLDQQRPTRRQLPHFPNQHHPLRSRQHRRRLLHQHNPPLRRPRPLDNSTHPEPLHFAIRVHHPRLRNHRFPPGPRSEHRIVGPTRQRSRM